MRVSPKCYRSWLSFIHKVALFYIAGKWSKYVSHRSAEKRITLASINRRDVIIMKVTLCGSSCIFLIAGDSTSFFILSAYAKGMWVFELNVLYRAEWVSWEGTGELEVVERGDRDLFANLWVHDGLDMWQAWTCESKCKILTENLKIIEFWVTRAYGMERRKYK